MQETAAQDDMGWPAHWKLDPPTKRPERPGTPEPAARPAAAMEEAAGARGPGRPSGCSPEKMHAVSAFIRLTGLSDTAAAAMAGVKRSTLARWKREDEEVELMLDQARFQYQAPRLEKIGETRMKDGQLDWRAQAWLVKFANPQVHGAPSRRRKLGEVELEDGSCRPEPVEERTPEEQAAKEAVEAQAQLEEALEGWRKFNRDPAHGVVTPGMLALLQQRRAIALRQMQAEEEAAAAAARHENDAKPGTEEAAEATRKHEGEAAPAAGSAGTARDGVGLGADGAPGAPAAGTSAPGGGANNVTIRPEIHRRPADPEAWKGCVTAGFAPDAAWDGAPWPEEEEGRAMEMMGG